MSTVTVPESPEVTAEEIERLLERNDGNQGGLISVLEAIQAKHNYLPPAVLSEVAKRTGRSLVDVYAVATFYKAFSLKPRGKHLCSICMGTACHVRGAPAVCEEFEQRLGIAAGQTTPNKEFTIQTVNCLGACALGPVAVVDGHYFSSVGRRKVSEIIRKTRDGLDKVEIKGDRRVFPVIVNCPRCNHGLMDPDHLIDGCPSIRVTISFQRKHGWLRLSSLYGSYTLESEYEIPMDTVVNVFCPHCHADLNGSSNCPDCGAPVVSLIVRGGGVVQICSRRGCKDHMLDLS
jgi:NADH-quinone oxidoreductase subunit E